MAGKRLDVALVEQGLAESRARAQALILGGGVSVDSQVVTKPSTTVAEDSALALVRDPLPYVSRGGLKLARALDRFQLDVDGMIAVDVGASTGGFTDVLLQRGARRVYAVDVGYGQLAWRLRNDPRVVVMERTNARNLQSLPEPIDLAVIDVSFISLRQVLGPVAGLLRRDGRIICLIKPQFEAGRAQVGKGGVVRDPAVWREVLRRLLDFAAEEGWATAGLERSPITGPAGNVEFLALLARNPSLSVDLESAIRAVAEAAEQPREQR